MMHADFYNLHREGFDEALAASEQMLLHVGLAGPKSAPFGDDCKDKLEKLVATQDSGLPP